MVTMLMETRQADTTVERRRALVQQIQRTYGNRYAELVVMELQARESPAAGDGRSPSLEPETAAPAQATPATGSAVRRQSLERVSSPHDPAEEEAEATAKKIMRMSAPDAGTQARTRRSPDVRRSVARVAASTDREPATARRRTAGDGQLPAGAAADISAGMSGGTPMPAGVRGFMEPRFGADFGGVRIHTGEKAAELNRQVNAQAFTVSNHVFFGRDRYQPESPQGRELIAHELTHTIQQGAAPRRAEIQRREAVEVTQTSTKTVQRLGIGDALDYFAERAHLIPGFRMFTIILGVNPINMSPVERSAANILRALIEFMPGGALIALALDNYGVFERAGAWVEQQLGALAMTGAAIRQSVTEFLDSLGWSDIFDLGGVWNRAQRIFTEPIQRIIAFAGEVASGIVELIRSAILRPLAQLAEGTAGYDLLKAVLGQDPITGEAVPRTAETVVAPMMRMIGQEEVWTNLQQANAVERAWVWFQGALVGLLAFVQSIPSLFVEALRSLQIVELVALPQAFARIAGVFAGVAVQFFSWAQQQVMSLLQIIFEVVAPGVMPYLQRAAGAFRAIIRDPIGFVRKLVRAGIRGFNQFATNFLTHLRASLVGWLTGALGGTGVHIPQAFTLQEIVKFILSVLAVTWQTIRQKLVRRIGEAAVGALETGLDLVVTLVREGPAAAWQKIVEMVGNLRDMVMEQIMTFVSSRIVQAAVTRLISLLTPAGAFIQAIIATYNTIMFFVERLRQIGQVAMAYLDSMAAIAGGAIAVAAGRVEQTMAGMLTLVISFLARIAGLGRVSDAITNIIDRIRAPIDRALDRIVDWIVDMARRAGRFIAGAARGAVARVAGWLGLRKSFTTVGGESHTLFFEQQRTSAVLMIRSVDMSLQTFLAELASTYSSDEEKLPKVRRAQQIVDEILRMTSTPGAGGAAEAPAGAPPSIDAAVEAKVTELGTILQEIGDGVSTEGATAAYRGIHWWVTPGQDPAEAGREYMENLNRQYVGARQLSDAVEAVLTASTPLGVSPTEDDIETAVSIVRDKMTELRDGSFYDAEGKRYHDRFHFLLGRFVTSLGGFQRKIRRAVLEAELERVEAQLRELSKGSAEYAAAQHRRMELARQTHRKVPSAYRELVPEVQASPFISTSLDPELTASYALGERYVPEGKQRRTTGIVGKLLIFVASISQLIAEGVYSIDELRRLGRIVMRKNFSESELTFTGEIPGSYLRAQLDVQADQSPSGIASNALGRAAAEAQRFGGLKEAE